MERRDTGREPCPYRILEDIGGAFFMGSAGGFLWHLTKGMYNSPKGERISGGFYNARLKAPGLGGNFAVWGGVFSSYDCLFQHMRQKDDSWNAIASGAATGGTLSVRGGMRAAAKQAGIGAVLLAIIEGVMVVFSRKKSVTPRDQYYQMLEYENKMKTKKDRPGFFQKSTNYIKSKFENMKKPDSNNINVYDGFVDTNQMNMSSSSDKYESSTFDSSNINTNTRKWFS